MGMVLLMERRRGRREGCQRRISWLRGGVGRNSIIGCTCFALLYRSSINGGI
ncbi:C4-dicarboxylate ABC transporter permease [Sesbania bispinosa]|nr:C4-dicarboxylate ABC transporter permease [Sesbania bispinosa]